jgi:hypothetical protein
MIGFSILGLFGRLHYENKVSHNCAIYSAESTYIIHDPNILGFYSLLSGRSWSNMCTNSLEKSFFYPTTTRVGSKLKHFQTLWNTFKQDWRNTGKYNKPVWCLKNESYFCTLLQGCSVSEHVYNSVSISFGYTRAHAHWEWCSTWAAHPHSFPRLASQMGSRDALTVLE